jgi:hypothetical protein
MMRVTGYNIVFTDLQRDGTGQPNRQRGSAAVLHAAAPVRVIGVDAEGTLTPPCILCRDILENR